MARPLKALPLLQNWDCHECGNCCTDYVVPVSPEERRRIEAQGWRQTPEYRDTPLFTRTSPWWQFWRKRYSLTQREGHRCIFLGDDKLCKIHAKFGFETKPFACRLYPYILVPAGNEWRLSLRYACPSATANLGRPIGEQLDELKSLAAEMETWGRDEKDAATPTTGRAAGTAADRPAPPLGRGQQLDWKDLFRVLEALAAILKDGSDGFPRRMLRAVALVRLAQQARFDKITGPRLRELLTLLSNAVAAETPRDLDRIPAPGWVGRLLFRSTAAVYLRKDSGTRIGVAQRGRLALIAAMVRMVRGRGKLPALQKGLPDVQFGELERPLGPLEPATVEVLERYYEVKILSLQFCGPVCYDLPVWEGFAALALTLPVILWLARGYLEQGQGAAVRKAITIVDENFGYNPLLGQLRQRLGNRILLGRGELDRLIAWYGR